MPNKPDVQDVRPGVSRRNETPFAFVGDVLALDLVNTELMVRGKPRDALARPEDVAAWWQAARQLHPRDLADAANRPSDDVTTVALHRALLNLRAALRSLFTALADGAPLPPERLVAFNALLAACHPVLSVGEDGILHLNYRGESTDPNAWLLPIALSAVRLLTSGTTERLHRCANDRCVLLFYDRTRSSTRRWCSAACKDRDRQRRRYALRAHR